MNPWAEPIERTIICHPDWGRRKNINTKPCRLRLCRVLKLVLQPFVNKFPTDATPTSNALRASQHYGKSSACS